MNQTPIGGADLVCPETIPDKVEFSLPRIGTWGAVRVDREALERIPISLPSAMCEHMKVVSQIGLKNIWLGESPKEHVRWNHARGVYSIGQIWLHTLYQGGRIPQRLQEDPFPSFEEAQILVGYALLLHDYGHLFFSHLLEEVLRSVHWVPTSPSVSSLEYKVLQDRLDSDQSFAEALGNSMSQIGAQRSSASVKAVTDLIYGWSGLSWLQTIVNSSIDADKIDYIRRDQEFLVSAKYPVRTRINFNAPDGEFVWLTHFMSEQYVNHAGLLCLSGRSALAASDLWAERMYLYDRFYLAPSVRVAERIAFEIILGFLIRYVMSTPFSAAVRQHAVVASAFGQGESSDLAETILRQSNRPRSAAIDLSNAKYEVVFDFLKRLLDIIGKTSWRDWECFEFMRDRFLDEGVPLEPRYRHFLISACNILTDLKKGNKSLDEVAAMYIVGRPLQFRKSDFQRVQEAVRPIQHQYSSEVLIDLVSMPTPLSVPPLPYGEVWPRSVQPFSGLLVPKGDLSTWGHGSDDLVPLSMEQLRGIDRPFGRLTLISIDEVTSTRKSYIFERLCAKLRQHSIIVDEI